MDQEFRYLECECTSPEHTLRIARDEDHTYITFFLEGGPWWRRLTNAVKYLFGYKCRYGHFDEIVLGEDKVRELVEALKGEW